MKLSVRRPLLLGSIVLALFLAGFAAPARAATIFAVNAANNLIRFDSETPGTLTLNIAVTGLGAGETVVGLDFRPSNFLLYALTNNAGNTGRIYTINTTNGVATLVSTVSVPLNGTSFGTDFNPLTGQFRIVSESDLNLRVNVDTGAATVDGDLVFADGDMNAGFDPRITAIGYTNNYTAAARTTLYGIDPTLDAIVTFDPENVGVLHTFFAALTADDPVGLDFGPGITGYVARANGANSSEIIEIIPSPGTFSTSPKGTVGGGNRVRDIAVLLLAPNTFEVNSVSNADDGTCAAVGIGNGCTLREAINASNGHDAVDTISFNITPGIPGVKTISVVNPPLPAFTDGVIINGYSQPGATPATAGTPATLLIELDGSGAGAAADGLAFTRGGQVRGLVINRFTGNGIAANNQGNVFVLGNYIGTDPSGTIDRGNGASGVQTFSNDNQIGGVTPADRNLISGNTVNGVRVFAITRNITIQGNYIGTDVTGTLDLGNGASGVAADSGPQSTLIGGSVPGARNIISGNDAHGVDLFFLVSNNVVQGNYIGTDVSGTVALPNTLDGVHVANNADANSVIGNVISANGSHGIEIIDSSSDDNFIRGNAIGLNASGAGALGNGGNGVLLGAAGTVVGGVGTDRNLIANNTGDGVQVSAGIGHLIFRNSIFANGALGINLVPIGEPAGTVTPNDTTDSDVGPNNLQNYPLLKVVSSGSGSTLEGTVTGAPGTKLAIDVYSNAAADASGFGEGQTFVTEFSIIINPLGNGTFSVALPASANGRFVTATASSADGTSEFAADVLVALGPTPTPTPAPTATPTPAPTATATPTATPTATATATPTATATATPTATATATPTATPTPTPAPLALRNVSTRLLAETADNRAIAGFIITGPVPKQVIIRALGPSLTHFGVDLALPDPTLELHAGNGVLIASNNNWRDNQQVQIAATNLPPTDDAESAIVATLPPGSYTAIVGGVGNTSGVVLVEVYDLSDASNPSTIANLSTRGRVHIFNNVMIGGFIIGGNGSTDVVVRGIGPSLSAAGVSGALQDPTLELRDGDGGLLFSNDGWMDNPTQAAALVALGLAPSNANEAAMAINLPAGLYTVVLAGKNQTIGIGLIEIYKP